MFATKMMIATLSLSTALVAQEIGFDAAAPATQDQQEQALDGAYEGSDGATARPRSAGSLVRAENDETGSIQFATQVPSGPSQLIIDESNPYEAGADESEELPLMLRPGVSLTRCGVTVSNLDVSSSSVLLSESGAGCFTSILVGDGVRASIDVSSDASELEALQVTVMGRAYLDVSGDQGLGHYDPREFGTTQAGIIVDGAGVTASDQEEMATITIKSSFNVIETLGASRDHEIKLEGASNLVRLHGADQVLANALNTRVMWMSPIFLQ